jgi:hypothetical protein
MPSTLTEQQMADPHDAFAIDPEIVLAMRADMVEHELARAASPPSAPSISIEPGLISPNLIPSSQSPASQAHAGAVYPGGPQMSGPTNQSPKPAGPRPVGPMPSGTSPRTMSDFSVGGLVPPIDPRYQQAGPLGDIRVPRRPAPKSRWAARTSYGFLVALVSTVALAVWDQYGSAAQSMIGRWIPPLAAISAQTPQQTAAAVPTDTAPAVQAAASNPGAAQPAPDTTTASAAPPAAPAPASNPPPANPPAVIAAATDSGPTREAMAHDMAAMGQQIEALKATVEQLRAGQDQMSQQLSKLAVPAPKPMVMAKPPAPPHPQVSALPPRAAATPMHKPRPAYSPELANAALGTPPRNLGTLPPAGAAPLPPPQAAPMQYQPRQSQVIDRTDGDPVDRPPMPVR